MEQPVGSARVVRVFVSSPGDCGKERAILDEVVGRINRTQNAVIPAQVVLFKWEDSIVPQIGTCPQAVIDEQTPPYDIYLGVMAERFGTPTGEFGSGTEKEFYDALARFNEFKIPWILFYFSKQVAASGENDAGEQRERVRRFKEVASKLGLCREYDGVRGSRSGFFEQVEIDLRRVVNRVLQDEFDNSLAIVCPVDEGGVVIASVFTPSSDGKFRADVAFPAGYVRVRVSNSSHLAAKNCLCELTKIEVLEDGAFVSLPYFECLRLAWAFEWDHASPDHKIDISPETSRFADVLFTYRKEKDGSQGVFLRALVPDHNIRECLELNRTYRLSIAASADNRNSQELRLRIDFSKNWDEFAVTTDDPSSQLTES